MSRIPFALLLTLGLAIAGCRNNGGTPPQATDETADSPASAPEAVVVQSLTMGDRACYMGLEDAQGQQSSQEASFELCQQAELVGQRVQLTRESTSILAASCQGDPECTDRDTVNLIVAAEPLP